MKHEQLREKYVGEIMDILINPRLKKLSTEELAYILVADIVLPAIEAEREKWVKLTYAKTDNPQ